MQAKGNTTYVCERCRCESELKDQYVSNSRLFKSVQYVCITCHCYAEKRDAKRGVINSIIFCGIAAMILQSMYGVEHTILFFASCFILAYPTILLHELGHAIACWMVGFRVQAIQIGAPRIAGFHKLGQTYCAAGFLPSSGMVIPLAIKSTPTRIKLLIISAAGIIANILGAIGGYLYLESLSQEFQGLQELWLKIWIGINVVVALMNLFSRKPVNINGQIALPDGAMIWRLLTKSGNEITSLLNAHTEAEIYFEFHFESRKKARQLAEDLYNKGRCSAETRSFLTVPDRRGENVAKTINHAREMLGENGHADHIRAVVQNNLAYCLFMYGRRTDLAEAEHLSKLAVDTMPMSLPAISTRGSILIELDRVQEGLALLEDKRFVIENASTRAEVMATCAKGYSLLGQHNKSQEMLKKAMSLAAGNTLVSKVVSEIDR